MEIQEREREEIREMRSPDLEDMQVEQVFNKIEPVIEKFFTKNHLGYFAHQHPLIICHDNDHDHDHHKKKKSDTDIEVVLDIEIIGVCCHVCNIPIKGTIFFKCKECNFYVHKSCIESPHVIHHPFHEKHPLKLFFKYSQRNDDDYLNCDCCGLLVKGQSYGCELCELYFHIFCLKLPEKIHHPLHPPHSLHLSVNHQFQEICNACGRLISSKLLYSCFECMFNLQIDCIFLMPNIKIETHNHPLTWVPEIVQYDGGDDCEPCGLPIVSTPYVRCAVCKFSSHVQCRLPLKIKSVRHVHPLMINKFNVPEDWDPNDEEFYCDACEYERNPNLPVYSCLDCEYVAHIECAFAKEVFSVKAEPLFASTQGDGEVDTIEAKAIETARKMFSLALEVEKNQKRKEISIGSNEGDTDPNLTFKVVIDSITDDELMEMRSVLEAQATEKVEAVEIFFKDQKEYNEHGAEQALYLDEAFKGFMEALNHHTESPSFPLWDNKHSSEVVVMIDDYMIPKYLAPILDALLKKHGNFGVDSKLSPKMKMCVTVILCEAIYSMCNTGFVDLTVDELFTWWNCFKLAECAGFQLQFAFDRLKMVLRGHFGDFAKAFTETSITNIDEEIEILGSELEALEVKRANFTEATKLSFIKDCLTEYSALEEQIACIDLF